MSNWNYVLLTLAVIAWGISIFLMMNGKIFGDRTVVIAIVLLIVGLGLWKTWNTNRMKKSRARAQLGNQGAAAGGGMAITPVLTPIVFSGALAFSLIVSVVFALYPAWRASRLKPVEALRHE